MPGPGGRTVGRVNIRVAPDTSDFRGDLSGDLERLERTLSVAIPTRLDTDRLAAQATRAQREIEQRLSDVTVDLGADTAQAESQIDRAARDRSTEVTVDVDQASLRRSQQSLSRFTSALSDVNARRATRFTAIATAITVLGSASAVAAGQVVQLAAALAPAAGAVAALPALAAAAGAALSTLAVATSGVGDAMGAALTGDTQALTEALEGLSPAARSVVGEVEALSPALNRMQEAVQESLFAPLQGQLTELGNRLLPTVADGMVDVADALGAAGARLAEFAGSTQSIVFLDGLFAATANAIRNANDALPNFLSGLTSIGTAGLPYVERLGTAIDDVAERFANWASEAANSGQITDWIDGAIDAFSQLGDIIGNVGGILGSVFSGAGDGGLLATIEQLTGALDDFLASAEGTAALEGIFEGLGSVGAALAPVITSLVSGIGLLAPAVGRIAEALGPVLTSAINGLAPALAELEPGIIAVVEALGDGISALVDSGALELLGTALSDILEALAPLLPVIGELAGVLLTALADILIALAPPLQMVAEELADQLAPLLPDLSEAFTELIEAMAPLLPPLIDALLPVLEILPDLLELLVEQIEMWTEALESNKPQIEDSISMLDGLIDVLSGIIQWLLQTTTAFIGMVISVIGRVAYLRDRVIALVVNLRERAVATARSLRDRAVAAFSALRDRAAALVTAARNRISGAFQAARERAVGAANALRSGVIGAISGAVARVSSIPSRIRNVFSGAGRWLRTAGRNIITGLINGINDRVQRLRNRMSDIASDVRDYFPFSPAKRGPLRTHPIDQAGRNLAAMLAEGMSEGERLVGQASDRLAMRAVTPTLTADITTTQSDASMNRMAAALEDMRGDVVLQVDSQEIARATRRGDRELARR